MTYDWAQIGINEITNLYLYGQLTTPGDLTSDALIRSATDTKTITLNAVSFMASGPGRFANGAQSSIVALFMEGTYSDFQNTGVRQTFSVSEVIGRVLGGTDIITLHQPNFDDGAADYALRSYMYNSGN